MLELKDITVTIDNKKILHSLSCTIEPQDHIVVLGHNGAGKSTFFNCISGNSIPTSGTIHWKKQNITTVPAYKRASFIAQLFQNPQKNGVSRMTVHENLSLAYYKETHASLQSGLIPISDSLKKFLEHFGLCSPSLLKTPMERLSGGQRQLVAFIMATLNPPQLLLLDEPTAALDPQAATRLLTCALESINTHKLTTLTITHDPELALSIGNKLWILEKGTITKKWNKEEKNSLTAHDLLGHIDYQQLKLIR
jgi:putative ABC transport system ATP-binding protein